MLVQTSMFLFEVPTGYIGDRFGKIRSLQAGTLILLLHCLLLIASGRPLFLMALGVLEGAGYTFCSGSDSALLYELLKQEKEEQAYLRLNVNLKAAQSLLTGITISLGAVMITWSWDSVYYVTALCLGISVVFLAMVREPETGEGWKAEGACEKGLKIRSAILYPNIMLFLVCIIGFSCFDGLTGSCYNFNQIIFQGKGISVTLIGLFFSATYLANPAAYFLAGFLAGKMPSKAVILRMLALQGALFFCLALVQNEIVFLTLSFICCLIPEVVYILADSLIQAHIDSSRRATMLSVVSMLRSLASAAAYPLLGAALGKMDVNGFMILLAFITFGALFWFKGILVIAANK